MTQPFHNLRPGQRVRVSFLGRVVPRDDLPGGAAIQVDGGELTTVPASATVEMLSMAADHFYAPPSSSAPDQPSTTVTEPPHDGPSLLLKAAELAEQAAAAATGDWQAYFTVAGDPMIVPVERPRPLSRIADVSTGPDDYGGANCRLLGASGPQHWRAVAAALRELVGVHERYWAPFGEPGHHCRHRHIYISCEGLIAVAPLARQVIASLQP